MISCIPSGISGTGRAWARFSACAARKAGKNRILTAAGIIGSRQEGAIRFSFCPFNTVEEMDKAAQIVSEQVKFLRKYRRR